MRSNSARNLALLAAAFLLLLPGGDAAAQDEAGLIHCGQHIQLDIQTRELPADVKFREPTPGKRAATILLDAQPNLLANANALAVWNEVVAEWEAILEDNVTLLIEADMAALGANVLGQTQFGQWTGVGYATVRDAMVADASPSEPIATQLPTLLQIGVDLPAGVLFANDIASSKANLRALGFDMSFDDPNPDATIKFSDSFPFDYDRSDGIQAGRYDFHGIVFHELGHALGYVSRVDYVDFLIQNNLTPNATELNPLDLYRLLPGDGAADFTFNHRQLMTGDLEPVQVSYNGLADLGMSTGFYNGDGRQASHWKSNELSGTYIGVMDATAAPGELLYTTTEDLRMFSLLGWDISFSEADCNANGMDDLIDIAVGTSTDYNGNGIPDECEPDCNANGYPDVWEIGEGISLDCNENSIPDSCDIAPGGGSDDLNLNGIPDECEITGTGDTPRRDYRAEAWPNPFNPGTTLSFELPQAGRVELTIYDVTGRRVRTLVDRDYDAGQHEVEWRGRADGGAAVSSGVYYAVMRSNGRSVRVKLTLLK